MTCAYCNNQSTTRDHIPPKAFFPKPRAENLITVPCCRKCNEKFGLDDEYVRAIVVLRNDISQQTPIEQLVKQITRGFKRKNSRGFTTNFKKSIIDVDIHTDSGICLGRRNAHIVNKTRLLGFVDRMLRGLFYETFGESVPGYFKVTPSIVNEINNNIHSRFLWYLIGRPVQRIGNSIFSYTWVESSDSPKTSIWLMSFYDRVPFGGIIVNPEPPKK